ncbi:MAG: HRDC domain-containing protein, partial [Phycisphaerales bacterium]|nr:HRDC domain-containing protein [Phycisphaerales bacterium]
HKLILQLTAANLGGTLKFSQWDHRPLSAVQIQYAANDVRYLPLLRHAIGERLAQLGNGAWATEECRTLSNPSLYKFDARSQRLRVRGAESLNARQRAVLRALLEWREDAAQQQDLPPRTFLRDEIILALASTPCRSVRDLDRIRGLPEPIEANFGQEIIGLIRQAEGVGPDDDAASRDERWDRSADKQRINAIWTAVQNACAQRAIDPTLAASKKDIERLVCGHPDGQSSSRLQTGWRRELLGDLLDKLIG